MRWPSCFKKNMLAYLFVLVAVAVHLRFLAMPLSFTRVAAARVFFGARMPRKHFFFQAEDGIRYIGVTGVQTCALPISSGYGIAIGPELCVPRLETNAKLG